MSPTLRLLGLAATFVLTLSASSRSGITPPPKLLYWVNRAGELHRYDPASGNAAQLLDLSGAGVTFQDLEVDILRSYIYMTDDGTGAIIRSSVDGSNLTTLISSLTDPCGITLDTQSDKLYWADFTEGIIH